MTTETHARASGRTAQVMAQIPAALPRARSPMATACPPFAGLRRSLGVSPSTVVEAYDRLAAEG